MCESSCDTCLTTTERRHQLSQVRSSFGWFVSVSKVRALADRYGLSVHMDGARVMNAAVAQAVPPSTILQYTHTVSVCLSKVGLQNTNAGWTRTYFFCVYFRKFKCVVCKVRCVSRVRTNKELVENKKFTLRCVTGSGCPRGNNAGRTPRLHIPGSAVP